MGHAAAVRGYGYVAKSVRRNTMQLTLKVIRNRTVLLRQRFQNRAEADRATAEALRDYPDAEVALRQDGTVILSAGRGRSGGSALSVGW